MTNERFYVEYNSKGKFKSDGFFVDYFVRGIPEGHGRPKSVKAEEVFLTKEEALRHANALATKEKLECPQDTITVYPYGDEEPYLVA